MSERASLYPTHTECELRHKPIEDFMGKVDAKLNFWNGMLFTILGAIIVDLVIRLVK